jgi:hypothetical protein
MKQKKKKKIEIENEASKMENGKWKIGKILENAIAELQARQEQITNLLNLQV